VVEALERHHAGRFLSAVLTQRIARGLRAGAVAAAATGGALIGLGVRDRTPGRALALVGQRLRGVPDFVTPDAGFGLAALLGAAHHTVVIMAWGAVFALLAGHLRGVRLLLVAALFAAAVWLLNAYALPAPLRFADGVAAYPPHRWFVYTVLALALAAGMRIAPRERAFARDD
jgi:hypothetical protein